MIYSYRRPSCALWMDSMLRMATLEMCGLLVARAGLLMISLVLRGFAAVRKLLGQ